MSSVQPDISKIFVNYLRNSRQLSCPFCHLDVRPPTLDGFKQHVQSNPEDHPLEDEVLQEAFEKMKLSSSKHQTQPAFAAENEAQNRKSRKRSGATAALDQPDDQQHPERSHLNIKEAHVSDNEGPNKKVCSPRNSPPTTAVSTPNRRGRRRQQVDNDDDNDNKEFHRGAKGSSTRQLWTPSSRGPQRPSHHKAQTLGHRSRLLAHPMPVQYKMEAPDPEPGPEPGTKAETNNLHTENRSVFKMDQQPQTSPMSTDQFAKLVAGIGSALTPVQQTEVRALSPEELVDPVDPEPLMIRQLNIKPVSSDQLNFEVRGIYSAIVLLENKCAALHEAYSKVQPGSEEPTHHKWQALNGIHRALLHEYYDFLLASQHPAASDSLKRLPDKYAVPARMWRHAIHSFLEILRRQMPQAMEHMLSFLYNSYSMMTLLYETVPSYAQVWVECLGDLARYRMAIEIDDCVGREYWTVVSRGWYLETADKLPITGRTYHHLAILARLNVLQQTYYYTKSLCTPLPFLTTRDTIMTLFEPVLSSRPPPLELIDLNFVRILAILYTGEGRNRLENAAIEFLSLLDGHIARTANSWLESGYHMGISISCSLLGFGLESNVLSRIIAPRPPQVSAAAAVLSPPKTTPADSFPQSLSLAIQTLEIVLQRWGDMNILPFLHTQLVFIRHLSKFPAAMEFIQQKYPWKLMAMMLNYLKKSCKSELLMDSPVFPGLEKKDGYRPLPEDFALRGLIYSEDYFPPKWFTRRVIEEEGIPFEQASMVDERKERILWIGRQIASVGQWMLWDAKEGIFTVADYYDVDIAAKTAEIRAKEIVSSGADL